MAATTTSCGVLLLSPQRELLLCHATGAAHWDIPKGVGEPGETPSETAVRETFEETGVRLEPNRLLDLGRLVYRPGKDLHLFATWSDGIDPSTCVCTSQFRDRRGRLVPEADAFEWTPFERVPQRCAKNMTKVLTQKVSLEELWQRVRGEGGTPRLAIG
jgi:8-oxo-dGTP pyrophosphatase MutT (NUDIX family)